MPQTKIRQITLAPKEARRLFQISSDLADTLEDIIESRSGYGEEFIRGLKLSIKQVQSGATRKINSLKELM